MTLIQLVRHGQSEWNLAGRLQGATGHVRLTPLGRTQAQEAADALAPCGARALYCSNLLRAVQSAEPISSRLALPLRIDHRLREQSYGLLEGRRTTEALACPGYDLTDPDARAPGGESTRDVHARVASFLADIRVRHPDETVVAVSHGDVIRAALNVAEGHLVADARWFDVTNSSLFSLRI